jgi:hypothetical protein
VPVKHRSFDAAKRRIVLSLHSIKQRAWCLRVRRGSGSEDAEQRAEYFRSRIRNEAVWSTIDHQGYEYRMLAR